MVASERPSRRQLPLRLDPAIHDAIARWAADDLRSVNAQIELLLREALRDAGRLPRGVPPSRGRGRPTADPGSGPDESPGPQEEAEH